jgi:hypothetical protein
VLDRVGHDDIADRLRHAEPQNADRRRVLPRQCRQVIDCAQYRQRLFVDATAKCRGTRRPLGPVQQRAAERLLELLNAARDGGLRQG